MSQQTINGYVVGHQRGVITVSKNGGLIRFTAAEVELICQIVNIALSMQSLPALPPTIHNGRFTVQFKEDDTLGLFVGDGREGTIDFMWSEGDELILTLDAAQSIALNELKMGTVL